MPIKRRFYGKCLKCGDEKTFVIHEDDKEVFLMKLECKHFPRFFSYCGECQQAVVFDLTGYELKD